MWIFHLWIIIWRVRPLPPVGNEILMQPLNMVIITKMMFRDILNGGGGPGGWYSGKTMDDSKLLNGALWWKKLHNDGCACRSSCNVAVFTLHVCFCLSDLIGEKGRNCFYFVCLCSLHEVFCLHYVKLGFHFVCLSVCFHFVRATAAERKNEDPHALFLLCS